MKTIAFIKSRKSGEKRRVLLPKDMKDIHHTENLYFEKGYGDVLGISDSEYRNAGGNVQSFDNIIDKDIICEPKIGEAPYLKELTKEQNLWGWIHFQSNRSVLNQLLDEGVTMYGWENMQKNNRNLFWQNSELAGKASVLHAFQAVGKLPTNEKIAIIGNGNVARGALKMIAMLGGEAVVYPRKQEALFKKEMQLYDVIINAVTWDKERSDHLISREALKNLKKGTLLIDISCDEGGGIESCIPTKIMNPIYIDDDILHYAVDNTPSILYSETSKVLSNVIKKYTDDLVLERDNLALEKSVLTRKTI